MKTQSLNELSELAARRLQLLVRLKAANDDGVCECVTCGHKAHYTRMHGGHFIPRGKKATKLLEENIHPQCRSCNGPRMKYHGALSRYTLYMLDMYGRDFVEWLHEESENKRYNWNRNDLKHFIDETNERVQMELNRIAA